MSAMEIFGVEISSSKDNGPIASTYQHNNSGFPLFHSRKYHTLRANIIYRYQFADTTRWICTPPIDTNISRTGFTACSEIVMRLARIYIL